MKFISLVSSGIDSPVATFLLSKNAKEIILVHADNRPLTDDHENENFVRLANHLKKICPARITACVVPHGSSLLHFKELGEHRFTCVFCKRMMLRYAEEIAKKHDAVAVIMGDSLGQVASQTLQNIRVIEEAVSLPVLRPLIGFDKDDVVQIAKRIGTYDLSIIPSAGCSAVPFKPATRATLEQIVSVEQRIDVPGLVRKAVDGAQIITL